MWLWKIEEEKIKLAKAKGLIPVRCYLPEWEKDIVVLFHDIAKSSVAYTAEIINVAISKVKRKHREHTEYLVTLNEFREIKPSFRMKDLKVSKEDYLSQKYRLPHRIAKEDEEIIRNKYPNLWTKTSKGRTLDYFKKNYLPQDLVFSNTVTVSSRFLPNNSPSSSPKTNSKPAAASSKGRGKRNSRKVKYFEEDEEEEEEEDEEYNVEQDDDFYEEKVDKYADSPKKEESTGDQEEEIQEEDKEFEDDVEIEQNVEEEEDIPIVNINNNNNGSRIGGKSIPHNLFNSNPSTSAFYNESYSFENHPHIIDPIVHEDSYLIKNNMDESLEHSFLENNSSTSSHHEGFVDEFFNFDLQAQANSVLEENIEMYDIASKKDILIETKKTEKKEDESGEIINRKNTSSTATSATVNLQNLDSSANSSSSTFSPTSTNNMTIVNSPNSQMTQLSDPKKKKFNGDQRKKRSSKSLEESEGEELQQQLKSKENSEKEEILPSSKKKRSPRSNGLTLSQEEEKNSSSPTSSPTNSSASANRKQNDSLVININFYGLRDCFAKCFSIDISKFKNLEELEDAILRKCSQFDQNLSKLNSTIPKNQLMSSSLMNSKNPNLYAIFEYHDKVYKELTSIREGRVTMDNIRSFADYIDVYISSSPSNRKAVFR